MKTNYALSFLVFLLISSFVSKIDAQKINYTKSEKNSENNIVFGRTYTIEELKKTNGFIRCASTEYEEFLQKSDPKRMTEAEFESWLAPLIQNASAKSQSGNIITIPVVVHVIHAGQAVGVAPNITDNQVISQITVMTQDFRRMFGTPGYNTDAVGADTQIQFALAKVDPNGNPTNGINRVNLCQASWSESEIDSYVKPQTIWDPTQYMNMWSVNFTNPQLLGYAQFPTGSGLGGLNPSGTANTDGVVAKYSFFGSSTFNDGTFILSAPYDQGRTMTHEVGHFLGLRHIWGDNSNCTITAGDTAQDYCPDTPAAMQPNGNCEPVDSCPSDLGNDMIENYMDYTVDSCMNIFTIDQSARMTTVMNNSPRRASLKTSTKDIAIPLFANDAEIKFENICDQSNTCASTSTAVPVTIYNRGTNALTSVTISYSIGSYTGTHIWTGNLAQDKFDITTIMVPLTAPSSGTITIQITNTNGTTDQRASNNSATRNFVASTPASTSQTQVVFTLQNDYWGAEVTWTLKNSAGTTIYSGGPYTNVPNPTPTTPLPSPITQTWNLSPNNCYVFTINDSYGDGIYQYNGFYNVKTTSGTTIVEGSPYTSSQSRAFAQSSLSTSENTFNIFDIYPNPVSDVLNVTKVSNKANFEVFDTAGRFVKAGKIVENKISVADLIKGNYILKIQDKDVTESFKFIKE